MPREVKVAVIGSGLAGLTAAYSLSTKCLESRRGGCNCDVHFEPHIFEKSSTLGMDSSSISILVPGDGNEWRVDVPMRSFQGGYYPQLIALYKHLGVQFRKTDYSYSFSLLSGTADAESRRITTSMIYNGRSGLAGVSMPSGMRSEYENAPWILRPIVRAWALLSFALTTFHLLVCYLWLLLLSIPIFRSSDTANLTYSKWTKRTVPSGFIARLLGLDLAWIHFTQDVLIPLFSAVCTCPLQQVECHPVEEFLDYVWLTLGTHHYAAKEGVQDVVSRLSSRIPHIHLSSPISSLRPDASDPSLISVHCLTSTSEQIYSGFHHVVIATQANRAVPILKSYVLSLPSDIPKHHVRLLKRQIECLEKFNYRTSLVINHTDGSLVPDEYRDRRDLNLISPDPALVASDSSEVEVEDGQWTRCLPPTYTMATHSLPIPSGFPTHLPRIYQTTNPIVEPREGRIISVTRLERAVLSMESKKVLCEIHTETGRRWWQCAGQANSRLGPVQGAGRLEDSASPGIWLCGSYAYSGIPLLEGCVVSARNVVEQGICASENVGIRIPW
ncbi:hypothetical protein L218DRAFT_980285 [Marasmius fiardii PR-910]|nr:hypothetical protein L218DRAFT_980285 [Marasmius fiardii PR-910]